MDTSEILKWIEMSIRILTAGTILFLVVWRGSTHSILDRIWRLINGNIKDTSQDLEIFVHETHSVDRFNFIYGINIDTYSDMNKIIDFMKSNNISPSHIKRARYWINVNDTIKINKPSRSYITIASIIFVLFTSIFFFGSIITGDKKAELTIKESGISIGIGENVIRRGYFGPSADISTCNENYTNLSEAIGISHADAKLLCDGIKNNTLIEFTKKTLNEQKNIGLLLMVFGIILFVVFYYMIISFGSAQLVLKKYEQKHPDNTEKHTPQ